MELKRASRKGKAGGDTSSQSFRMVDNGFEISDADHDVHVLLHVEVVEIFSMNGDCCLERLFEDLCKKDQHTLR